MNTDEARQVAQSIAKIDSAIETLQDARDDAAFEFERRAKQIQSKTHGFFTRTTENAHYTGTKDGRLHFDIIDGYDGTLGRSFSLSVEEIVDGSL